MALLSENNDPENHGDLHEGFDIGYEDIDTQNAKLYRSKSTMSGENVWPSEVPEFRDRVLNY